jgi:hypothetical protein
MTLAASLVDSHARGQVVRQVLPRIVSAAPTLPRCRPRSTHWPRRSNALRVQRTRGAAGRAARASRPASLRPGRVDELRLDVRLLRIRASPTARVRYGLPIASHVKPWARSDSRERADVGNGICACPTHDSAFDAGLLTVSKAPNRRVSERQSRLRHQVTWALHEGIR